MARKDAYFDGAPPWDCTGPPVRPTFGEQAVFWHWGWRGICCWRCCRCVLPALPGAAAFGRDVRRSLCCGCCFCPTHFTCSRI